MNEIWIHPANPSVILVASDDGLYRSTNQGGTFTQVLSNACYDVKANPLNPTTLYTVRNNTQTKICEFWLSEDAGITWSKQTNGWYQSSDPNRHVGGARIGVTPADTSRIYAYLIGESKANDDGFIGVFRSDDRGASWLLPNPPVGGPYSPSHPNLAIGTPAWNYHQGFYNCAIMVSSTDPDQILVGGLNLWRSDDGATTFSSVAGYIGGPLDMHVDMQDFRAYGNNYWITTDGGIYYSTDFFHSQPENRSDGINAAEFWGFGSGWQQDVLVGGTYHNGNKAHVETYGEGIFLELGGGEDATGYVNPGNSLKTYFSDIGGRFLPPILTGTIQGFSVGLFPNQSYWAGESSELEFHPQSYNIAFLGNEHKLWKTENGGSSFSLVHAFGTDSLDVIRQIEISRSNPQVMYVSQHINGIQSKLWKTTNGGLTWSQIPIPSGNSSRLLLALNPLNENELWIAYSSGSNGNKIFKTTNGGQSFVNLTTPVLNNQFAHTIAHIGGTDGGIYYCTNQTVFYRDNSMPTWVQVADSLPSYFNCNIARPFYRDGKIRIASYGKGIWENDFYEQPNQPVAQISVDAWRKIYLCEKDTFYFLDYSMLNDSAATWQWTFAGGNPVNSNQPNPKVTWDTPGTYLVTLTVTSANGISDTDSLYIEVQAANIPLLISEGFENQFPPNLVQIFNPENDVTWSWNLNAGGFGLSSKSAFFNNYDFNGQGRKDDMQFAIQFQNPGDAILKFDVAYARYSSQYRDSLQILVSPDCGQTWDVVYTETGTSLATAPDQTTAFFPNASQWRTDSVDLTGYIGSEPLLVRFRAIGRYGNNLFLDNINLNSLTTHAITTQPISPSIYPNPVNKDDKIWIEIPTNQPHLIRLIDSQGKTILSETSYQSGYLPLLSYRLTAGFYVLQLKTQTNIYHYKVLVQ
ncbi:MAG: T9SS type A sorting domain-containing protein [Bacteroidia bacterium]|nr:T9SS type A sorting domain-containing protein [Bacteroidia bacterium]